MIVRALIVAGLLVLQQAADKYRQAAEKIELPAKADADGVAAKSEVNKKTVALLMDAGNWAAGLRAAAGDVHRRSWKISSRRYAMQPRSGGMTTRSPRESRAVSSSSGSR